MRFSKRKILVFIYYIYFLPRRGHSSSFMMMILSYLMLVDILVCKIIGIEYFFSRENLKCILASIISSAIISFCLSYGNKDDFYYQEQLKLEFSKKDRLLHLILIHILPTAILILIMVYGAFWLAELGRSVK